MFAEPPIMSTASEWKTWEGRVVDGRFPLRQWLGGSEHSAVFLTERPGHASQKAAIKLIPADVEDSDHLVSRWRTAAKLSHPHLIRIFDGGRFAMDDTPMLYVVTELAEEDLSQILPQRPLTPTEVTDLLPPLLDALSYLHGKGLVHGRIKPSNVLATGDQLKLSADEIRSSSEETNAAEIRRRDVYDAPETAAGIIAPAGDVWSLGVTLATALMQRVPFAGDVSQGEPGLPESIPSSFRGIVRECLHLDPQRRCSIDDIQTRLQPPGRSVPAEIEPIHTVKSPAAFAIRNRFGWRVLIPVVVLVLFVLGLRIFYKGAAQHPVQIPAPSPASDANAPSATVPPQPTTPPFTTRPADTKGSVTHQVLPEVPQSAMNTITGTIKVGVRVEVDTSGKVTAAKLTTPGPSRYFANLALKAAQRWEFSPPEVNGQAAASVWQVRFHFRRTSTQAFPEQLKR
jgi:TonB family protein